MEYSINPIHWHLLAWNTGAGFRRVPVQISVTPTVSEENVGSLEADLFLLNVDLHNIAIHLE